MNDEKPKRKRKNTPPSNANSSDRWTIFDLVLFSAAALFCLFMGVVNVQANALPGTFFWVALGVGLLVLIYRAMEHLRAPTHFERFKARMNLVGFGGIALALAFLSGSLNFLLGNMIYLPEAMRIFTLIAILSCWIGLTIYFGRFIPGRYESDRDYQKRMGYRKSLSDEQNEP
ncbi:MAG: hypothetical protein MUF87_16215 [Anaerolineae bacterium]|jgi:hypothetical protein|nr:hypothetical protein [Anaerolineae bacterium]